ncbi:MAG: SH3 domain-containing protein, partial [Clostridia bacterium]|nr:SH3 domain-containing protein [Clostridia bacterium]
TFQRLEMDGFEPEENTPETITVTLSGDGSVNPSAPVFYYHVKEAARLTQNVTVRWALTDGTVLTEQTVTLTEGVPQTFQRVEFEEYEAEGTTPETITVVLSADGSVTPSNLTFFYHVKVTAPVTAEVTVTYVADHATILRTDTITVSENMPQTFQRLTFEGFEPDADTPESITVTVAADGSVTPQGAVFNYHTYVKPTEVPPAIIPVHYVDVGGGALAADQYVTVEAGRSIQLAPDTSLVPVEYDPSSAGMVTIQVSLDGIASPDEVTFVFKHPEAEETPIPVGEYINRWATTTAKGVHIRTEPAKKGNAGTINKTGTKVYAVQSVLNAKGESWTKVIYDGKEGYISSQFLQVMTQAQSDDYQDTLSTPVPAVTPEYVEPTEVVPTDAPATEIPATEIPSTPTPSPMETPTPEVYTGYALTEAVVALRDEVSNSDSSIMTTLKQKTLVTVKGQVYTSLGEAWSQVQTLDNLIGFVPDSTLRRINAQEADYYIREYQEAHPTPTPVVETTEAPIQITGYAYTLGDNVPFRNTYSDKSIILSQLQQNTPVYVAGQVYDTEDGWPWHIVMHNGTWGYIRSDMLRMMNSSETEQYLAGSATPAPTAQITAKPYDPDSASSYGYIYASNNGAVNMRKTASTKANVIKRLRNYAFCLVLGSEKIDGTTWYRISYDGLVGYVQGGFFKQMSLAELEEFLNSKEYQQGIVNNTTMTDASATVAPLISQEEQNVNSWTDPNSGLNVTYATWAPFATTPPLVTGTPLVTMTPSPTPLEPAAALSPSASPVVSSTPEAIPTVEIENIDPQKGSSAWIWIILGGILVIGTGYIMVIRKRNQARAAERARQRKAQIARQQTTASNAERPKTGTYPQQNGTVHRPYTEVPAPRTTQTPEKPLQSTPAGANGYKPVFQQNTLEQKPSMPKESEKTANTYEKPAQTRVENISSSATQTDTTPDNSASEGEETRRTGRRAARRKAMEALHEDHDHKPEI